VPIVWKSGSLNHLENSGPVKACNGNAFTNEIIFDRVLEFCKRENMQMKLLLKKGNEI
jgi:hypothetical protein